jgi:solute carrier family 19 (thiamine transporter), member 2/3
LSLQIVEVIYGTYSACEVAYFAYIYAKTDKENYQIVTSHTRAAMICGRFFAAVSSQLLVYFDVMNSRQFQLKSWHFVGHFSFQASKAAFTSIEI